MKVGGREFGPGKPMFIAEISCNHAGSEALAQDLVREASESGADAVKFQLYTPEQMVPEGPPLEDGPWAGMTLRELYGKARTPREWLPALYELARDRNMIPFCSVFDPVDVAYLEHLGAPIYKIASPEADWGALVSACRDTGKPVLVSDGAIGGETASHIHHPSSFEINRLPMTVLMRCVSEYPAPSMAYGFMDRRAYTKPWGLSDHSKDPVVWATAAALGATAIEAHLMLTPKDYRALWPPLDMGHSMLPFEFELAVEMATKAADLAYTRPSEGGSSFRRRWHWARDLPAGHVATSDDFVALRAHEGLVAANRPPSGPRLTRSVKKHQPVEEA